jgi:lipopolysaccharide export system permease protein
MKKTIYKYFFYQFINYFSVVLFALAVVVWTIQSVNFLDLVTEDGHAFSIYFLYSMLTLSKVLTKLIPFCFLIAIVLTILKFEKDNELIALWTSGLNKINIVNFIFRVSVIIMVLQLTLTVFINPSLLNLSRTLLKNSELQFIPTLLKEKQFSDAIEGLTIFIGKKNKDNEVKEKQYENIFIRDDGKILSQVGKTSSTIFAKYGHLSSDERNLILYNGNIQKLKGDGTVNIVKFEKTIFNFSGIATKSISEPKIQETSTLDIINCIKSKDKKINMHNCQSNKKSEMDVKIEFNKRFGMPMYIPLISLVCCFLLASRKDKRGYIYNKYIYFFSSFIILTLAEIIVRYSGVSWTHTGIYYLVPLIMFPLFYYALLRAFKYENLS